MHLKARTNKTAESDELWNRAIQKKPLLPHITGTFFEYYFRHRGRDLPWRNTQDPFRILVAEVMLQKTHSRAVSGIWTEFFKKWPSARQLSRARLDSLRSLLKPLGFAKRVVWLRQLGETLSKQSGENVPQNYAELINLPGVGRYTANSVLCQAFGESVPMVDVNAARVYGRVYGVDFKTSRQALAFAESASSEAMHFARARDMNLGVFDFAQEICRVKPRCDACPLAISCEFGKRIIGKAMKSTGLNLSVDQWVATYSLIPASRTSRVGPTATSS